MSQMLRFENLQRLLKASSLFSGVHQDVLDMVCNQAQTIKCKKSEYIQVNHNNTDYFYIVDYGSIMLSRVTTDGDSYVIDILDSGGIFGISNLFNEHDFDIQIIAEAINNTMLWQIPVTLLEDIIKQDTSFTQNFLCMNLNTRLCQDLELEHRTLQNVSQRIGCFLLSQCQHLENSPITVKLPYSKNTIAAKLGVRPETFSRALHKLEKETGLQAHGSKVNIPDTLQLKSYVCPSCSLNYPCHSNLNKAQIY